MFARLAEQYRSVVEDLVMSLRALADGLQRSIAGLRRNGGRLAVLDGRLKRRGWGRQVLEALEPWVALTRLLPNP